MKTQRGGARARGRGGGGGEALTQLYISNSDVLTVNQNRTLLRHFVVHCLGRSKLNACRRESSEQPILRIFDRKNWSQFKGCSLPQLGDLAWPLPRCITPIRSMWILDDNNWAITSDVYCNKFKGWWQHEFANIFISNKQSWKMCSSPRGFEIGWRDWNVSKVTTSYSLKSIAKQTVFDWIFGEPRWDVKILPEF